MRVAYRYQRASGPWSALAVLLAVILACPVRAEPGDAPDATGAAGVAAPPAATFDVFEIAVDGNTLLGEDDIRETLAPFTGPARTPADIDRAREALAARYLVRGYQTVSVTLDAQSRQTVARGLVVFRVEEGRIRRLSVTGARYHSSEDIRAALPSLAEGEVPNFNQVQAELAALNTGADRQVTPTVRLHEPTGGLDVDLAVADSLPLHGVFELNNRYSNGTTETRAMAMLSYDNLWQRGHGLTLMTQTAPERTDDGTVMFASYAWRFADPGFSLQFSGLRSDSDVATVGGISVIGKGNTLGIKASWQPPAMGDWQTVTTLGVERKDFLNRIRLDTASIVTPLLYYPVSAGLSLQRREETTRLQLGIDAMLTLPGAGSDAWVIGSQQNRFGASNQLRWLRAGADWEHDFATQGQLALAAAVQLTDLPLVSGEQYSVGGADSVRGYLEAEAAGDQGLRLSAEWRSPTLAQWRQSTGSPDGGGALGGARLFAFADAGRVAKHSPVLPGEDRDEELASVGIGASLTFLTYCSAALTWGQPLLDGPWTATGDGRLLFSLRGSF